MIKRWDTCLTIYGHAEMEEDVEGDYVLYTDHLAAMSELKDQGQAIVDRYEERLKEKDKEIERLKALISECNCSCHIIRVAPSRKPETDSDS